MVESALECFDFLSAEYDDDDDEFGDDKPTVSMMNRPG